MAGTRGEGCPVEAFLLVSLFSRCGGRGREKRAGVMRVLGGGTSEAKLARRGWGSEGPLLHSPRSSLAAGGLQSPSGGDPEDISEDIVLKIHEYQAKEILRRYGVATPRGKVTYSPDEAAKICEEMGGRCVVKAQI